MLIAELFYVHKTPCFNFISQIFRKKFIYILSSFNPFVTILSPIEKI